MFLKYFMHRGYLRALVPVIALFASPAWAMNAAVVSFDTPTSTGTLGHH